MKFTTVLLSALVLGIAGCSGSSDDQQQPARGDGTPTEAGSRSSAEAIPSALITHMHRHAEQFEDLNDALAAGDLDAVYTPAWWLSRHEQASGLAPDWRDHLSAMREAASNAEAAPDLATARVAVERIARACNGCHTDADVDKVIYPIDPR